MQLRAAHRLFPRRLLRHPRRGGRRAPGVRAGDRRGPRVQPGQGQRPRHSPHRDALPRAQAGRPLVPARAALGRSLGSGADAARGARGDARGGAEVRAAVGAQAPCAGSQLTLAAQALECARGGRTLFTGLSFTLEPGEALRIAGANGSGKTSLLRILCGLLAPTQGEVRWDAMAIGQLQEEYSRRLVYLGHSAALKDELSAAENLAITCRLAGQAVPPASLDEALARFGLRGSRAPVKRLSQGQRRRAALARLALSEERPLWLLDEPFAALDGEGVKLLEGLVARHLSRGGAVAFTTHQDAGIAAAKRVEL